MAEAGAKDALSSLGVDGVVAEFVEDVVLGVLPLGGASSDVEERGVDIHGDNGAVELAVATGATLCGRADGDAAQMLVATMREMARCVVAEGWVTFKIVRHERCDGAYRLERQKGDSDLGARAVGGLSARWWTRRPRENAWGLGIPKSLGGAWRHRRTLRALERFERNRPPYGSVTWWDEWEEAEWWYRERQMIYRAAVARRWGWLPRHWPIWLGRTDYYAVHRAVRLRWAQAVLREHIVKEWNGLLHKLKIGARVVVRGLPSASEVERTQADLRAGEVRLDEAEDACGGPHWEDRWWVDGRP